MVRLQHQDSLSSVHLPQLLTRVNMSLEPLTGLNLYLKEELQLWREHLKQQSTASTHPYFCMWTIREAFWSPGSHKSLGSVITGVTEVRSLVLYDTSQMSLLFIIQRVSKQSYVLKVTEECIDGVKAPHYTHSSHDSTTCACLRTDK